MADILLRGGVVVAMHPQSPTSVTGDVLVRDGLIAAIGENLSAEGDDATVIDLSGDILLPGFVDTHRHTWQSALRHRLGHAGFGEYGAEMLGVIGPIVTPEDVRIGNALGALSALDCGTTTLLDWSHALNSSEHADAAIAGLRQSEMRAVFAYGYPRSAAGDWTRNSRLGHPRDIERVRAHVLSDDDALVTLAMAARGPEMTPPDIVANDFGLARGLGIPITMHVGAGDFGPRFRAVERLHEQALLGPDVTLVHMSSSSQHEMELVADAGASVSIGPWAESTMPNVGGCPVPQLLAAGIEPALSGDTEVVGSGDMFTQMRAAYIAGRRDAVVSTAQDTTQVTPLDVLRWATYRGAMACGLGERTGSLAPGLAADLIVIRSGDPNLAPMHDPVGAAVLAAHPGNIDLVMVGGRIRKRDGKLIAPELPELLEAARASAARLLAAAGAH